MWYRCYINTKTFFIPSAFYFKHFHKDRMINICRYISFLSKQGADLRGANLLICRVSRGSHSEAEARVGSTSIQYICTRTMTLYSPRQRVNIKQNKIAVVNWVFCQVSEKELLKIQEYPSVNDFEGKKRSRDLL